MKTIYDETIDLYYRPDTWDYNICLEQRHYIPLNITPGSIVLDLGAHIGSFAKLAIDSGAKLIYCFEAARDNYLVLLENERLHSQIRAFHRVITSDPSIKSLQLHRVENNTGMHSVYRQVGNDRERVTAYDFVSCFELCEPDFVKCDVEGSEYFFNWTQALSAHRPKRIVIEYHLDLDTFQSVAKPTHILILKAGYRAYKGPDFTHAHQTLAFYEKVR